MDCKVCRAICQPHQQNKKKKYANNNFARLLRRSQDNTMIFDFLFLFFLFSTFYEKLSDLTYYGWLAGNI